MTQTVDKTPTTAVTAKPFPPIPDGKREAMLNGFALREAGAGKDVAAIIKRCKMFSESLFATPMPLAEIETKVNAYLAAAKRVADRNAQKVAERAETDPDKVVAMLNKKLVWLSGPKAIFDLEGRCIAKKEALKAHYANTCVMLMNGGKEKRSTHFDAWMQSKERREHVDVTFEPGRAQIVNDRINLWKRWVIAPIVGDISPWNDLLDHLFGSGTPERTWAQQWFASPIQNPGQKLHTAMVIWGGQGVGKTMVIESVGKLYGKHFTTIDGKMLRSKYNGWAHDALLVFGEEKDNDQRAEANMLKHLVTGHTVVIEEKYRSSFECSNRMNLAFSSNHPDAFHLSDDDRRYFVWNVTATPKAAAFYDAYGAWIGSAKGLAALMDHMLNVDMTGFDPYGHAPMTKAKLAMIELSKSDLDQWVADAITDAYIDNHIRREIVMLAELVQLYQHDTGAARTTPKAMGMALRRALPGYKQDRISARGKRPQVVTLRNHAKWEAQDRTDWSAEYLKASPAL